MVTGAPGHTRKMTMTRFTRARLEVRATAASAFGLAFMLSVLVVLASGVACDPAWAQDNDRPWLLDRIFNGSERFGPGDRAAQPAAQPAGDDRTGAAGGDLVVRLDRLESQIRQLTGTIEQLQFRNQQLEGQVRRMQEDTEYRFQELGAKGGARVLPPRPQSLPPPAGPTAAAVPGRRGDAFDPSQNPNAPGAPHALGTVAAAGGAPIAAPPIDAQAPPARPAAGPLDMGTMAPPLSQPPGQAGRGAGDTLVATLPPSQSPRDEYDLAYGYMLRKDYALAEDSFRNFLTRYPTDRLAGDATYWFGESLFLRQRYRDAAEAFLNVTTKFESSPKAPDALLRLGQSLAALGEKEAACASLGEVVRKFPRASAVVKQGVEREQKRAHC
jgi:tol-pal system protein YbgF